MVAQILAAHGLRGELKCRVVTDFPERFRPGVQVLAGSPPRPYRIATARFSGGLVYLRFQGVRDRTAAEAVGRTDVLVAAADAVPLPEGQFYWRQVIGLRVDDTQGQTLGIVQEILETGANHVYVVRGERGEVLIPAIKEVVKQIDPEAGRMVVELLPGLLPEAAPPRVRRFTPRRRKTGTVSRPSSPPP